MRVDPRSDRYFLNYLRAAPAVFHAPIVRVKTAESPLTPREGFSLSFAPSSAERVDLVVPALDRIIPPGGIHIESQDQEYDRQQYEKAGKKPQVFFDNHVPPP